MSQPKFLLVGALFGLVALAQGQSEQQICVPLGSIPVGHSGDCSQDGYYVNADDAARFYICAESARFNFTCQEGLVFNVKERYCDWPENVECDPTKQNCPYGSIVVIPPQPTECSDSEKGFYRDTTNPKRFFHCENGKRIDFECQRGLIFDLDSRKCEWPENMKCYTISS